MIFQYQSPKRTVALITGKHGATDEEVEDEYVSLGGEFDPAETDEDDDEVDPDGFGFRPQGRA